MASPLVPRGHMVQPQQQDPARPLGFPSCGEFTELRQQDPCPPLASRDVPQYALPGVL